MAITPPVPIPPAPALPQRNDPATFEARADAYYAWQSEALPDGIDAQSSATYTNAQEAAQSAVNADQSAQLSEQFADAAEAARDKAQEWAESDGEPEPGSKSAKTWAGEAEIYRDSAEAAAAAAGAAAGLPSPLQPGKVLGAISPTAVAWVIGLSEGYVEITSSQSFPVPDEATWIYVELWGGGGSGGAALGGGGNAGRSQGGGGGAKVAALFRVQDLPSSIPVVIGSGGAAVTANAASGAQHGNDGGDTSFGPFLIAPGGKGGMAGLSTSSMRYPSGGSIGFSGVESALSALCGSTSGSGGCTTDTDGGDTIEGGAGGGGVSITSLSAGSGGTSLHDGDGGDAAFSSSADTDAIAEDGQFPSGGGGAASSNQAATGATIRKSGKGGAGRARIYWW